jgi:hypothetical protein
MRAPFKNSRPMPTTTGMASYSGIEPYLAEVEHRAPSPEGRCLTDTRVNTATGLTGCRIVDLPRVADPRGNLTFIEGERHVPFPIARVFYLYDVPGGASRGGHAHKGLQQLIVAVGGSFDVVVDDGIHSERYVLNRSYYGLLVPRLVWQELDNFSSGGVCLVLASEQYEEADYYRDYPTFEAAAHRNRSQGAAA